jgi:hypothetical protein
MDMTYVIPKRTGLTVDENRHPFLYRPRGSGTAHQLVQMAFSEYHLTSHPGYCIKLHEEMNVKGKCHIQVAAAHI